MYVLEKRSGKYFLSTLVKCLIMCLEFFGRNNRILRVLCVGGIMCVVHAMRFTAWIKLVVVLSLCL